MIRSLFGKITAALCFAVLLSTGLLAQQLATLKVTVNDQSGAVIPGATITLQSRETGAKRSDLTASNGYPAWPQAATT
jgi:hypothetical protein